MNDELKALVGNGESKIIECEEGIQIWNGQFIEKYANETEYRETKWQLETMVSAFVDLAIAEMARKKEKQKKQK